MSMSIVEAREKLTLLPEQLGQEQESGAVMVTRRGKPVLAILSWDLYESIVETLEVLGDSAQQEALHRSIQEIHEGQTLSLNDVRRNLGL